MALARFAVTGQRGQVLTFLAVVIPLVLVPVVAYAVDAASIGVASANLEAAAAEAAEAAAQQLDVAVFRASGSVVVDTNQSIQIAGEIVQAEAPGAAVDLVQVDGSTVTVAVSRRFAPPLPVLGGSVVLHARATARLVSGYSSPSSRLPLPTSTF